MAGLTCKEKRMTTTGNSAGMCAAVIVRSEMIELNKVKIMKALKDFMFLSKYLVFHSPELIKAHYGEW